MALKKRPVVWCTISCVCQECLRQDMLIASLYDRCSVEFRSPELSSLTTSGGESISFGAVFPVCAPDA